MNPLLWGKHYWFVVHVVALKYPEVPTPEDRTTHRDFYASLWKFLPCKSCSQHYRELFEELPIEPYLGSRDSLFEWTVIIHNRVNATLKKPEMPLKDALRHYTPPDGGAYKEVVRTRGDPRPNMEYTVSVLVAVNFLVILIVIMVMVWMWHRLR
jgi:hypothetical protein